ncbi:limbic system-associated membrane protein-like [Toxotes jaculatrix]|uniref:limbic system-associated membrane protein-like n=1 Tax=Toxotes jaculatrix TaxID=941984 RepID=UPI001B3B00E0|nr:limbic system-associated membrane protein-like [Toxotes jaculatrix]XP_040896487.1 limbic system-associated membrane protein-like [Toxotes jaculatrix]
MNIVLISALLGVATLVLQVAAVEECRVAHVSVRPPGSNIYLGESVLLQCTVESHSTYVKRYQWYRWSQPHTALNPRHLVSGDSYFITAVTREDAGEYSCQAECWENKTRVKTQPVALSVSELVPPSLSLTPNTRQMLTGENFTVQCPTSETNSSGWKLKHFSSDRTDRTKAVRGHNSPPGGGVNTDKSEALVFNATREDSGLYWCEHTEGRSSAVSITVSYGNIILKTPAFPVFTGSEVVLYCQHRTGNHSKITFFKNGAEIDTSSSSSSDGIIKMTIKNVTQEDEGLYKCASQDRKLESPGSWLSVRPDRPDRGSWKWIVVSFGVVLLLLVPLTVWLLWHYRSQWFCTRSCWPFSKLDAPAEVLPATKQDVTEVQWDLSWMEMSSLLDKQLYPGT